MRLLKASLVKLIWRNCNSKTPVLLGNQSSWLTPIFHFTPCRTRNLCTTLVLRKDSTLSSDQTAEKLDLDVWKSVMLSPGLQEEKENENEEGALEGSGQDGEHSPLEATRELVETWRQAGRLVPEQMSEEQLQTLENLSTKSSKKKYLKYLAIKEGHKKARKVKQEKRRSERMIEMGEKKSEEGEEEGDAGGQLKNTFMLQFWQHSVDSLHNWRAAQAMLFGQPLVFDMSYEQHMSRRELENTVSQLLECEGWNRRSADPFHLHFCNLQPEGGYHRELVKRYGASWNRLLITATEQNYVDTFPHSQLVYLTADSPKVLKAFDHNKVYIVGSLVDRSIQTGVSLANAKRLKLATARLPLDEFLHWDTGAKNLTLDQMIRILLRLKDTGKWEKALEFVPKRKHEGFYQPRQTVRSGTFLTDKAKTFINRETGPTSSYKTRTFVNREMGPTISYKTRTFVNREAGPTNGAESKPLTQSGVQTVFKPKRFVTHDTQPKSKNNWWEEE
ncbi:hypothetical protein AAFF_G00193610 [Aldrovandia affinis]|uniref:tRNA methyltransferase 10 homolog C n=1 Tax=Aldrovandia affinis TaxID=143900 RepID=A0AAD7WV78_9TELE|nr:hypothetical protein AAFF_G00193610 [Aldrovandia affinis]